MKKTYPDQDINDLVAEDMDPDTFYKGGQGSGVKGHKTHHYEPARVPGYKFSHSEHNDKAAIPNVVHHYESEHRASDISDEDKHHDKLASHMEAHHGKYHKLPDGRIAHKIMGTSLGVKGGKDPNKKHQFSVSLKKI